MSAKTPDIIDSRIARARAMREAGAETAAIARACGVGVSTIYRWAEAHGFRVCDLDQAALDAARAAVEHSETGTAAGHTAIAPPGPQGRKGDCPPAASARTISPDGLENGSPQGKGDRPPAAKRGPSPRREARIRKNFPPAASARTEGVYPGPQGRKGKARPQRREDQAPQGAGIKPPSSPDIQPPSAEELKQAAARHMRLALELAAQGQMKLAEQALRLATRFEDQVSRLPPPAPDEASYDGPDYRQELTERLQKIHDRIHALDDPDTFEPQCIAEQFVFYGLRDPDLETLGLSGLIERYTEDGLGPPGWFIAAKVELARQGITADGLMCEMGGGH